MQKDKNGKGKKGGKDKDGKGKDKVKGKTKDKSGGKTKDRSDVICHYCSKKGHIKSECRKRIADEAKGSKVQRGGVRRQAG